MWDAEVNVQVARVAERFLALQVLLASVVQMVIPEMMRHKSTWSRL